MLRAGEDAEAPVMGSFADSEAVPGRHQRTTAVANTTDILASHVGHVNLVRTAPDSVSFDLKHRQAIRLGGRGGIPSIHASRFGILQNHRTRADDAI